MEAPGSRQSRAASRYASGPSPPVFSGPVRKWKKQWVSSHSSNLNNGGKRNDAPPLLLCRWTPLAADEPPKRRCRYTPIVPIEKGNKKSGEDDDEGRASLRNESIINGWEMRSESDSVLEKPNTGDLSREEEETQEPSEDQADSSKSLGRGAAWSEEKRERLQ